MPQTTDNNNRIAKNTLLVFSNAVLYDACMAIYELRYIARMLK